MATPPSGGQPFEWLSNGLFGRGKSNDGSIENCTDVGVLCDGINADLRLLLDSQTEANERRANCIGNPGDGSTISTEVDSDRKDVTNFSARLSRVKYLLYDERTSPPPSLDDLPAVASATVRSLTRAHPSLLPSLLKNLGALPFEARKDVSAIFNYLLVCGCPDDNNEHEGGDTGGSWRHYASIMMAFVQYILDDTGNGSRFDEIIAPIVGGHNCWPRTNSGPPPISPDVALHCGAMFRSTLRHLEMFKLLLSEDFAPRFIYPFLDSYVHQPNFEVASDALETVRLIFTGCGVASPTCSGAENDNKGEVASAFLLRDYEEVIDKRFNIKMLSESASYVTRRASIKLLSSVLLTRLNYSVMIRYISSRNNLRIVMFLLRDPSPHITLDAFHVFKVFVANPSKPDEVVKILVDNKQKLVRYLDGLHRDKESSDEQFRDEKALVIATLEGLEL